MSCLYDDGESYSERPVEDSAWGQGLRLAEEPPATPPSLDPLPNTAATTPEEVRERGYAFARFALPIKQLDHWLSNRCTDERLRLRILTCGTNAWIELSPSTNRYRVRSLRCGSRLCPRCRIPWALRQQERITSVTADVHPGRRKLATLTLRSSSAPLNLQVRRLWKCFNRLRERKLWKRAVRGSAAVLEVTWNDERGEWHPHLHIVLDATWIDQKDLSRLWLKITGDSKIVDIRAVRSFDRVSDYLSKYLLKPVVLPEGVAGERFDELYGLYKGSRFVRYSGTMRPLKGEELYAPEYPTDWQPVMPLIQFLGDLERGDQRSELIAEAIRDEALYRRRNPFLEDTA